MCGAEPRKDLPLVTPASGCRCCAPETTSESVTVSGDAEYSLEALTCGRCVESVQKAATALEGVRIASVELNRSGLSRLVVSGSVADGAVRAAVIPTGYAVATR